MEVLTFIVGIAFWAFVFSQTNKVIPTLLGAATVGGLLAAFRYPNVVDMADLLNIPSQTFAGFLLKLVFAQLILALIGVAMVRMVRRLTR